MQDDYPEMEIGKQLRMSRQKWSITEAWDSTTPNELGRLNGRMPTRVKILIEGEGERGGR